MNQTYHEASQDYQRIEKAIEFLEENFHSQPPLEEIAKIAHLSEFHFQRLFSRWVGISPKRFLQFLTKEYAKELLHESRNLLDVTYETGLSSPGRLHDLFVSCEAMTPGEYKNQGEQLTIEYGIHPTPFGECLIAVTDRGICGLTFVRKQDDALRRFQQQWQNAHFIKNEQRTADIARLIFFPNGSSTKQPMHIFLKGTNFQLKVWEALLKIPYAHVVSYSDIATMIEQPKAVRAVANAVASNPVPFLIPCHRVIRKLGDFGGYQGGTARKKAILGWEAATAAKNSVHA